MAGVLAVGGEPAAAGEGTETGEIPEDLREAWDERAAIMAAAGGVPRAEAACLAWAGLQAHGPER